jgi:predicted RNA-binding Zn-ribbon protein involved in translation (DUF1610 family)
MKQLVIDIETSPNLGYIWSLWKQNISLGQLKESGEILCFAAKWYGEKKVMFHSVHKDGRAGMLQAAWDYVNEADAVVHFNGTSFDMKWLAAEWVRDEYTPPSPYVQVDLKLAAQKAFRFPSNKLDYLAGELLDDHKTTHTGFSLWTGCMAGDPKAWRLMEKYNRQDVVLTENLYDRIKPWCSGLPNPGLHAGDAAHHCPQCGSTNLTREGYAYTAISKFQRYRCTDCGRWSRGGRRVDGADLR